MLTLSMTSTSINPTATASARSRICSKSASRRRRVRTLESRMPLIRCRSGRMTAAATTGPASDPRPTSSMPAMCSYPARRSSRSWRIWASRGRFARCGRRPLGLAGTVRSSTGSGRAALAEGGGLADAGSQEGQLLASSDAVTDHLNLVDAGSVDHERSLHADAAGDPAHRDRLVEAAAAHAHDGSLEDLNPFTISLDHLDRNTNRVAGSDRWPIGPQLFAFQLLDGIHDRGTSLSRPCWPVIRRIDGRRPGGRDTRTRPLNGGRDRRSIAAALRDRQRRSRVPQSALVGARARRVRCLLAQVVQLGAVALGEWGVHQQVGPTLERAAQGLAAAPSVNLAMMPRKQHLRNPPAAELLRPGVLRK